jgi:ribosomal-protein-alanine N-acetyltransferase
MAAGWLEAAKPGSVREMMLRVHRSPFLCSFPERLVMISTPSLDLVLVPPALATSLIDGDLPSATSLADFIIPRNLLDLISLDLFRLRRDQVVRDPSWAPWSLRAVVLRPTRQMIGHANFHGPPGVNDTGTTGAAEIGYTIFPQFRNRGYATESARAMIDWANRQHNVRHFISGIAPDNRASLRVNEKLGFVATGQIVDGELIFELRL